MILKLISWYLIINYFPFRLRRTKYHIGGFTPRAGDASGADNIKCCLFDYYNKFAHYTGIKAHPTVMTSFYFKLRIKNSVWVYEIKHSFYPLQVILILPEVSNTLLLMARTSWRPREPRYEFYSLVTWIRTLSAQLLKNISAMN